MTKRFRSFLVTGFAAGLIAILALAVANMFDGSSFASSEVAAATGFGGTPTPTPTPTPDSVIQFSRAIYDEDQDEDMDFTLIRTGNTSGTAVVNVSSMDGTATGCPQPGPGCDYQTVNTNVTLMPGQTQAQVRVRTFPVPSRPIILSREEQFIFTATQIGGGARPGEQRLEQTTTQGRIHDSAEEYENEQPICMTPGGTSDVYPSTITVSGEPGPIGYIRVTLYDLSHTSPESIDALLVGPGGQKFILMSKSGGPNAIEPNSTISLTFDDDALQVLPDSAALTWDGFEPTSWGGPVSNFPAPAPAGPYSEPGSTVGGSGTQTLSGRFGGTDPNGVWSLYVRDTSGGPRTPKVISGCFNDGWGLEIFPLEPTAAGVEVSGRVMTPDGRGLRNATVTMVDSQGVTRTATTSSFGYYSFEDVEVGSNFVMSVQSRRYRFAPRVVQVLDSLTDVDFTGLE